MIPWDAILKFVAMGISAIADVVETAQKKGADAARAHAKVKIEAFAIATAQSDAAWRKANDEEAARKPSRAAATVPASGDALLPLPDVTPEEIAPRFDLSEEGK